MSQNIPTKLNNPGDLKNPATGNFMDYSSPEEGFTALKSDLQAKISGKTKTGLNGNSTLAQFASVYAPSSDKNDPATYATNLAQKLGVTADTPIGSLHNRLDDFASAIADNEGYQGNRVLGTSTETPSAQPILSTSDFAAKIKAKYPQYQNVDDATLTQKILAKYPQYQGAVDGAPTPNSPSEGGFITSANLPSSTDTTPSEQKPGLFQSLVQGVTQPFLQGASSIGAIYDATTGNQEGYNNIENNGADYGYFGKAKPIGAGFDINKPISQNVGPLLSAAGTGAQIGSDIAFGQSALGGLKNLITGGSSIVKNPAFFKALGGIPADQFAALSNADKLNYVTDILKSGVDASDKMILEKAVQEFTPGAIQELGLGTFAQNHPVIAGAGGLLSKLLKGVGGVAVGAGLGAEAGNLYNRVIK